MAHKAAIFNMFSCNGGFVIILSFTSKESAGEEKLVCHVDFRPFKVLLQAFSV